tara:strand:- start:334 stop:495 length:162 start_codon:yes stop_codon:yes gene_type:complete
MAKTPDPTASQSASSLLIKLSPDQDSLSFLAEKTKLNCELLLKKFFHNCIKFQ